MSPKHPVLRLLLLFLLLLLLLLLFTANPAHRRLKPRCFHSPPREMSPNVPVFVPGQAANTRYNGETKTSAAGMRRYFFEGGGEVIRGGGFEVDGHWGGGAGRAGTDF